MPSSTEGRYFDVSTVGDLTAAYDEIAGLERSVVGQRRFTRYREFAPALAAVALGLLVLESALRAGWLREAPVIDFAQPVALLALLARCRSPGALARFEARRRRAADAVYGGGPGLRPARRVTRAALREALLLLAIAALAFAAAGPTWGNEERPLVRRGIDVVIALDVSRSMTADDVAPSRGGWPPRRAWRGRSARSPATAPASSPSRALRSRARR